MNTSRPNSIKIAMVCLLVASLVQSVQMFWQVKWSDVDSAITGIFGFCIGWLLVFMIYRRMNWARWVYAGVIVLWLAGVATHFKQVIKGDGILLVLYLVLCLAAAITLFTPASSSWFRAHERSA